jgi:hypothetical protein
LTGPVPARIVYTALLGGHEELLEQPVARSSPVPFVCFTDDPSLRSDDWEIQLVEPALAADAIRSARALKILGHPRLDAFDETLWIDNRVRLRVDPTPLLDGWLLESELAVPGHSFRADVVTEFGAVLAAGLDEAARLYEQLTHYTVLAPDLLLAPAPWTGIVARRRTEAVATGMRQWLTHVFRYSRRDQLSFVQAMHETSTRWTSVKLDNLESEVHEWRDPVGRSPRPQPFQVADSLQPPIAALAELRLSLEQRIADLASSLEAREETIRQLGERVAELEALRGLDLAELDRLRFRLRRARRKKRLTQQQLERARTQRGLMRRRPGPPEPGGN